MKWADMDHSFCEEHLLGLPEYYNSLSSLFIIFFGIYGLMNLHNDLFIDILYASLAIVGFGSTGYHWYGNIGWALFDEIPMIVTIFSGIIYTDNVYFLTYNNKYIKENSDSDLTVIIREHSNNMNNMNIIKTDRKWNINNIYIKKRKLVAYLFGMYTFMIYNVMSDYRMVFPQLFTGVVVYMYYKIYNLIQLLDQPIQSLVKYKALNSLLTVSISGAIWSFTEVSCKYVDYHILLIGHPMWHFFIGHGFYNLIQVVYYIKLHNINYRLRYDSFYLLQMHSTTDAQFELL